MKNFTFKSKEVVLGSYMNAKGNEVITVSLGTERIHSFRKSNLDNQETFTEDVVFALRDSVNRNSVFNKTSDCVEFASLLISAVSAVKDEDEEVLPLLIEEQNSFNQSVLSAIIFDNKHYAEESAENVADYFLRDFDAQPEGWDSCFDFCYDEVSTKAKEQRRIILVSMLVSEGYIPETEA